MGIRLKINQKITQPKCPKCGSYIVFARHCNGVGASSRCKIKRRHFHLFCYGCKEGSYVPIHRG